MDLTWRVDHIFGVPINVCKRKITREPWSSSIEEREKAIQKETWRQDGKTCLKSFQVGKTCLELGLPARRHLKCLDDEFAYPRMSRLCLLYARRFMICSDEKGQRRSIFDWPKGLARLLSLRPNYTLNMHVTTLLTLFRKLVFLSLAFTDFWLDTTTNLTTWKSQPSVDA